MLPSPAPAPAAPNASAPASAPSAPKRITPELLRSLPKTDLHCHLDGSVRLSTIIELAEQQGVRLPAESVEGLGKALHVGEQCDSLEDYLTAFKYTLAVMQDEESLYRCAYELAADCAAENVRWLEVRYSPILHTNKGLALEAIVEAVHAGLRRAESDFGIQSGEIVCGMRNISTEASVRLAKLAVAFKHRGVVGFDLAGAEHDFPAKAHREAFYVILNNNVNCTAHAGEAYGAESIHQAIHYCGAHRIGHGVRLREDTELLDFVNDHRIELECCLTSNVQTRAVKELATHPFRFYYDYGLRVTLNTDNRLISNTSVTKEMWLAHQHLGFTLEELKNVTLNGFKAAFMPYRERKEMLRRVSEELALV